MSVMESPQSRPRSKTTFSFKSDKSHGSDGKSPKEQLRESPDEKRRSHLTSSSKANPNAAMNEVQPVAAALEKPTLQSLRSFQHTDTEGNPISEPDLSNPTRSRWERPLDTIRSFEAAIDNEYRRRAASMRADANTEIMSGYGSRRSSYYGGNEQNRFSQVSGFYGGGRPVGPTRDSWVDNGYGPNGPPRARYPQRMQTDPGWGNNRYSNGHGVYPNHNYQQSRDTVITGGSGSQSEPYSTDPSSENSSIERGVPVQPVQKPDLGEQYGFQGFGGGPQFEGPILEETPNGSGPAYGRQQSNDGYFPQNYNGVNMPPPVPAKTNGPIKLDRKPVTQASPNGTARPNVLSRNNTEKRKSWFKRRFSKDS